jgi:hypothetical protein
MQTIFRGLGSKVTIVPAVTAAGLRVAYLVHIRSKPMTRAKIYSLFLAAFVMVPFAYATLHQASQIVA